MSNPSASLFLQVILLSSGGYRIKPSSSGVHQKRLLNNRLPLLRPFLDKASTLLRELGHNEASYAMQLDDEDPGLPCFRFDAPVKPDDLGPMIPDPYVLGSNGFQTIREKFAAEPLPPWEERLTMAIWRGSSTGSKTLKRSNLEGNRRYQLCRKSLALTNQLDARFTAVVQCPNHDNRAKVLGELQRQDLITPLVSPWHLALHRWIVEIDGNVNSWGLLWKLLSGSCILRVKSHRRQWYHHRLKPWIHVIPIAGDLHDLEDILAWCYKHSKDCATIAANGQRLAREVIIDLEQDQLDAIARLASTFLG